VTQTLAEPPPVREPRRATRVVAVAVVLCIGAAVLGYRWLTGDRLLAPSGWSESFSLQLGHTYYSGLGGPYGGKPADYVRGLDVRDVHIMTSLNNAEATITVLSCVETARGAGLTAGGNAVDRLDDFCLTSRAFRPGRVDFGQATGATGFVVAITPRRAGTVHISGASISYRDGLRTGNQRIGLDLTVTAH
jgi:hypothetical protein